MTDNASHLNEEAGRRSEDIRGAVQRGYQEAKDSKDIHRKATQTCRAAKDLHDLAKTTCLQEDHSNVISIGIAGLAALEEIEEKEDGPKTSMWFETAKIVSNAYHQMVEKFPTFDLYEKAIIFEQRLIEPLSSFKASEDRCYGLSRIGVLYVGKHVFHGVTHMVWMENASAYSKYAVDNIGGLHDTRSTPISISIYENRTIVLLAYFRVTDAFNILEEASRYSEIVLDSYDERERPEYLEEVDNWPLRFCRHGEICEGHYQRYLQTDRAKAKSFLKEAIALGVKAKDLLHENDHSKFHVLKSLATWYTSCMEFEERVDYAAVTIELLNEALKSNVKESDGGDLFSIRSKVRHNLLCFSGSEKGGEDLDACRSLNEAISDACKAVERLKTNDQRRGGRLKELANLQKLKCMATDSVDKDLCLDMEKNYIEAAKDEVARLSIRLAAALDIGLIYVKNLEAHKANNIFQYAVGILLTASERYVSTQDLRAILRESSSLAEYSASLALQVGNSPYTALKSLESSRCLILGQHTKLGVNISDSDLAKIRKENPSLVTSFLEYRNLIRIQTVKPWSYSREMTSIYDLSESLASYEEEIREILGSEKFPKPPFSEEKMKELACYGPVIVVNVSRARSDAIIVTRNDIKLTELPYMSYDELEKHLQALDRLSAQASRHAVPPSKAKTPSARAEASDALKWLWDVAVSQIFEFVPLKCERVWWIPSGLASRAPFHAAGDHSKGSVNNTISRVTSSYISSFKALHSARQQADAAAAATSPANPLRSKNMLLVTVSQSPPYHVYVEDLNTQLEERVTKDIFGSSTPGDDESRLTHLDRPSPMAVLGCLHQHSFVHFACHGINVGLDPFRSGLLLVGDDGNGELLKLAEIEEILLRRNRQVCQLAYLSACSTAQQRSGGALAQEAVHMGNSFQAFGYPNVVATMQKVNDNVAGQIAKDFYENLLKGENEVRTPPEEANRLDVAGALHQATLKYRNSNQERRRRFRWIPFIHIGA